MREQERDGQCNETEGLRRPHHRFREEYTAEIRFVAVAMTTGLQTTKMWKMLIFKNTRRMYIGLN